MKYRKLGNTGLDVSVLGFGTWQLGGMRWECGDEKQKLNMLSTALEQGINVYDAAVVYGQYRNEEVSSYPQSLSQEMLGKAFEKRREEVIYCVKIGQFDEYSHRSSYNPQRLVHQFEESLRRLKTDYIDICLIHAPSIADVHAEKAITVLQTLRARGDVRFVGYSFEAEPEHALAAVKQDIDVIMLQYNLLQDCCAESIEQARQKGIGILCGGPFRRGYLSGKIKSLQTLPQDDYWQLKKKLSSRELLETIEQVKVIQGSDSDSVLRQRALHFVLEQAGVSSAVVGHQSVHEILDNVATMQTIHSEEGRAEKTAATEEKTTTEEAVA